MKDFFDLTDAAQERKADMRVELHQALRAWLLGKDAGGIVRKQLFRITTLETVAGDKGGNLRRGLAEAATYVPTLATLQRLEKYLEPYGLYSNTK